MSSNLKRMRVTVEGKSYDVAVEMLDETPEPAAPPVRSAGLALKLASERAAAALRPAAAPAEGAVTCPLAGVVREIHVREGEEVDGGAVLVTLEAMKMNAPVRAPRGGRVTRVHVKPDEAVEEGALLVTID